MKHVVSYSSLLFTLSFPINTNALSENVDVTDGASSTGEVYQNTNNAINTTNTQVNSNISQIQSVETLANTANNKANNALSDISNTNSEIASQKLLIQNNIDNINIQNDQIQDIFASSIAVSSLPDTPTEKGSSSLGLGVGGTDGSGSALAIGYGHTLNYSPKNIFGGQSIIFIKANAVFTPTTKAIGTGVGINW